MVGARPADGDRRGGPFPPLSGARAADGDHRGRTGPEHRLVVYGTLRPGGENHFIVADLGEWEPVILVGRLSSWGRYPAFVPDPGGVAIEADLVTSPQLPGRWAELDRFEGPGYRRTVLEVETAAGPVHASCYVLADD
jgi:gamma-glutamylcyclotransferase (GGCT)/AIG2-like uncharacterized protein YtfP